MNRRFAWQFPIQTSRPVHSTDLAESNRNRQDEVRPRTRQCPRMGRPAGPRATRLSSTPACARDSERRLSHTLRRMQQSSKVTEFLACPAQSTWFDSAPSARPRESLLMPWHWFAGRVRGPTAHCGSGCRRWRPRCETPCRWIGETGSRYWRTTAPSRSSFRWRPDWRRVQQSRSTTGRRPTSWNTSSGTPAQRRSSSAANSPRRLRGRNFPPTFIVSRLAEALR